MFDGGHAGTGLSIARGPRRRPATCATRSSGSRSSSATRRCCRASRSRPSTTSAIARRQLLIVLNDNEMSISPTVGALSKYLSEIKLSSAWQQSKSAYDRVIERIPVVGPTASSSCRAASASRSSSFAQPGQLFEDLGITYIGVMPGHDLRPARGDLPPRARAAGSGHRPRPHPEGEGLPPGRDGPGRRSTAPRCRRWPSRRRPTRTTGSTPPRTDNGDAMASTAAAGSQVTAGSKAEAGAPPSASVMANRRTPGPDSEGTAQPSAVHAAAEAAKTPNYTAFFAEELVALGATDRAHRRRSPPACRPAPGLAQVPGGVPGAVHRRRHRRAARRDARHRASRWAGCGRSSRSTRRSSSGPSTRPSTTSARTTQPVAARASTAPGLVGEDGTSHQGMFTLPAQRQLPNLVIASPRDEQELRSLLRTALRPGPPVRAALPARRGLRRARASSPSVHPGRARRGPPRGPRPAVRGLRADRRRARSRSPTRSRPRAGPSASSTPGSPSRSTGS